MFVPEIASFAVSWRYLLTVFVDNGFLFVYRIIYFMSATMAVIAGDSLSLYDEYSIRLEGITEECADCKEDGYGYYEGFVNFTHYFRFLPHTKDIYHLRQKRFCNIPFARNSADKSARAFCKASPFRV